MSELADRVRNERQLWALPGGSHDRLIRSARRALPAGIAIVALFLALAPLSVGRDISFVLAKDSVEIARERLKVTEARYRGEDAKGQPFLIRAGSAVQQSAAVPVVNLADLTATIRLANGPAAFAALRGRYDMRAEQVKIDGPMLFKSADGYRLLARDVTVDLEHRTVASNAPIDGQMPLGNFRADRFRADLETRSVTLEGRARLHILQGRSRGT